MTGASENGVAHFVSCLMITKGANDRIDSVRRAVADYCRQSHPRRELVIVQSGGDAAARADLLIHVETLGRSDIRVFDEPESASLGALRNRAGALARGNVLCQWDDDDMYHPDRLSAQLAAMQ